MRRFLLFLLFLLSVPTVYADQRSERLLNAVRTKIQSYKSYRVGFTATVEGEGTTIGNLTVSGRRFVASVFGQELYYDGTMLWNYLPKAQEVTVERLDPADPNILSNPAKLMNIDPKDFEHSSLPAVTTAQGKELQTVELKPKQATADYTALTLYIDPATSLPVRISIAVPGSDRPIELQLKEWKVNIPVSEATFRFDPKAHPGVEIIDFR
ncbi:outer membrane lipoprotein carrier protein LolA [uncultured Rikenella sp.]|uniref:LolA family protein n=1 Tax=uncultured Rikenella sp. TaxID=368003 RepID=UPI0025CFEED0|nr:outer membrane lipoprotein carrier protein LolA [uncultured Rikenella sp.]